VPREEQQPYIKELKNEISREIIYVVLPLPIAPSKMTT
jgi:hypothetical protein